MHMRIHSGKKLQKCNPCENVFVGYSDVTNNMKIHSQNKVSAQNEIKAMYNIMIYSSENYKWNK